MRRRKASPLNNTEEIQTLAVTIDNINLDEMVRGVDRKKKAGSTASPTGATAMIASFPEGPRKNTSKQDKQCTHQTIQPHISRSIQAVPVCRSRVVKPRPLRVPEPTTITEKEKFSRQQKLYLLTNGRGIEERYFSLPCPLTSSDTTGRKWSPGSRGRNAKYSAKLKPLLCFLDSLSFSLICLSQPHRSAFDSFRQITRTPSKVPRLTRLIL